MTAHGRTRPDPGLAVLWCFAELKTGHEIWIHILASVEGAWDGYSGGQTVKNRMAIDFHGMPVADRHLTGAVARFVSGKLNQVKRDRARLIQTNADPNSHHFGCITWKLVSGRHRLDHAA